MIAALLPILAPIIGDVLKRVLPDENSRQEAERALKASILDNAHQLETAAASIIKAEAASAHKITAIWRPVLMLVITAILANNYILAPYVQLLLQVDVTLNLPDALWSLLNIGVGGYIVGRSGEKIAQVWKNPDVR